MDHKAIKEKIAHAKSIVIAGHINPDGDSIGSLLSLGLGMEKLGKRVYMLSADAVPAKYRFLPGADRIISDTRKNADLAISVDCSNKEMLGSAYNVIKRAKDILEIDHHEFKRPFGNLFLIDYKAAAVGELVYRLLQELGIDIDRDIAQNLLTSIIVETNSFRLPNVRPLTFKICAELIKKDVDFYNLVDMVFWSRTRESAVLTGICLARCKFLEEGRLAWSIIREKDFKLVNGKDEDIDAVADEIRAIQGVEIVVLFREKSKKVLRVSLRSKGRINVAAVAEYYKGGGHFDIAGCTIPNNPESIRELLVISKSILR
ncbi:MAG: bifunctional oligoribonuclease/PAP phosphatase NrnA [Candidatus Omnitrophica bacterium]|nr:bifunctional oligoribonuclease/PAP phosphatase NrnA [Candidatus Omnitrophota bacterium]MDD5552291.1 bifunctional oligoribonuclease/PAP phosphatase NrnA [Candidatus Omnitrophota bacterium]